MGKRILRIVVFVLLIALIAVGVTVGAVHLFQLDYQSLSASQEKAIDGPTPTPDLTAQKTPEEALPGTGAEESDREPEAFGTVVEPAPEVTLPVSHGAGTSTLEAKNIVSGMTLEEKICQMLFVTQESLTGYNLVMQSGAATQSAYNSYPVGGIIYFASNLISVDQTTEMIRNIQDYAKERTGLGLFIGVDEEGGSVARLADSLGTTQFQDMAVYGEAGDAQAAYDIGATISGDMRTLGFNVDFAPVADVLTNRDNTTIGVRSFGSNPDLVADFVGREVLGFVEGGVLCAPKHFRFADPKLEAHLEGDEVVVSASAYARSVELDCGPDVLLEDNYFDMNAGTRRVKILRGKAESVAVRSVYDIR